MLKQTNEGNLKTTFILLPIPFILFVSKSNVNNNALVFALHITPWFQIGFNWRLK